MNSIIQESNQQFVSVYNRYPIILDHGEGMSLFDVDGKCYLDFGSGIGVCSLGYHDPNYTHMLQAQIEKLVHTSNLFYNVPTVEAAKRFNQASPMEQVFFTNNHLCGQLLNLYVYFCHIHSFPVSGRKTVRNNCRFFTKITKMKSCIINRIIDSYRNRRIFLKNHAKFALRSS